MAQIHEFPSVVQERVGIEKFLPKEELEYDTGVLDGGIYVGIEKNYQLRIRIQRTKREKLEPLTSFFPSDIKLHKHALFLEANWQDARFLLETFYPHVRLQKPIFGLAISYLDWLKTLHTRSTTEEKDTKERYIELMRKMKKELYDYDIGPAPLSPRYLAAYMDQARGSIDTTPWGDSLQIQMHSGNKSFIQHLQKENGGNIFPHDDPNPKLWRATGRAAEVFLEKVSPFFRHRHKDLEDIRYVSRKPGMAKRITRR